MDFKVWHILKLPILEPHFADDVNSIRNLALFYSVYYGKAWLTRMFAAQAPSNDLAFIKTPEEICDANSVLLHNFQKMVKLTLNKIKDHSWYLSKWLVGLAFFDTSMNNSTKEATLLKYQETPRQKSLQTPECFSFSKKN